MACEDKVLNKVEYCAAQETKFAGFNRKVAIGLHNDVLTWPTFNATAGSGEDESDVAVKTSGAFAWKTDKCFQPLEGIVEQVGMNTKASGKGFVTELTTRIQNTPHNRGWLANQVSGEFVIAAQEADETFYDLLGRKDFPAKMKKDSAQVEFGKAFNDDEFIELVFEFKPYMPAIYTGAVSYTPAT